MKEQRKIVLKNAELTTENGKDVVREIKKDEIVSQCDLSELYEKIDNMGFVKVQIGSESPMSSDEAKQLIDMYKDKEGISMNISSEEEF